MALLLLHRARSGPIVYVSFLQKPIYSSLIVIKNCNRVSAILCSEHEWVNKKLTSYFLYVYTWIKNYLFRKHVSSFHHRLLACSLYIITDFQAIFGFLCSSDFLGVFLVSLIKLTRQNYWRSRVYVTLWCPSFCLFHSPAALHCCGFAAVGQAGGRYLSIAQQQPRRSTARSRKCG